MFYYRSRWNPTAHMFSRESTEEKENLSCRFWASVISLSGPLTPIWSFGRQNGGWKMSHLTRHFKREDLDYFLTISPMSVITLSTLSWQSKRRLEKNFQTQSIAERSEFIKNKEQRQCGQWEHGRPTPSDMPGRVDPLHGLVANFSSLKTNKIPAGRVALCGYLGAFLPNAPNLGVRRLAGKDHGDFRQWFQWGSVSFGDDLISPCPRPWCKALCVWARTPLHKLNGCYIISSP